MGSVCAKEKMERETQEAARSWWQATSRDVTTGVARVAKSRRSLPPLAVRASSHATDTSRPSPTCFARLLQSAVDVMEYGLNAQNVNDQIYPS